MERFRDMGVEVSRDSNGRAAEQIGRHLEVDGQM